MRMLGTPDRRKLDEYLDGVREIERRIQPRPARGRSGRDQVCRDRSASRPITRSTSG